MTPTLQTKAARIKLVLTDCDGVLTDAGVYYGESGEIFKRFNIRDGMGVVRLRELVGVETGIVTGETSRQNKALVDYCCETAGGQGCLRELAELIIEAKLVSAGAIAT